MRRTAKGIQGPRAQLLAQLGTYPPAPPIQGVRQAITVLERTAERAPQRGSDVAEQSDRDARTITYCGGGIAASSNAFVMTRLGFTDVVVEEDFSNDMLEGFVIVSDPAAAQLAERDATVTIFVSNEGFLCC